MNADSSAIVAQILRLSGPQQVNETASLFHALNRSSIDSVDRCFELKEKVDLRVRGAHLWPAARMRLDRKCHNGTEWTGAGWQRGCELMDWRDREKCRAQDLYDHLPVNFIERRSGQLRRESASRCDA